MHYLMVCMPQEHTYSALVSLPVGVLFLTIQCYYWSCILLIDKTFQWFWEQCSFRLYLRTQCIFLSAWDSPLGPTAPGMASGLEVQQVAIVTKMVKTMF